MDGVSFFVPGTPAPKGSMKAFAMRAKDGRVMARVTHDNKRTKPWSTAVAYAAQEAMRGRELFRDTPLVVAITFALSRPSAHSGKRGLKPSAPRWPQTRPDLDKLTRAACDALQGIVFDEDSRIVMVAVAKIYAAPVGAAIRVSTALEIMASEFEQAYALRVARP